MSNFSNQEFSFFLLNCRRGIWELDILLLNFIYVRYYDLSNFYKINFYFLLLESDQNLYDWLVRDITPINQYFSYIIFEINKTNLMFDFSYF